MGLFNTFFFLAGVPKDWGALDQEYPKGLKIFTQYVLIPLATIYMVIILAYEGKLLIQWMLPKGIISSLILGYAVYGMLSMLLVYPIRDEGGNQWIKIYNRFFYILLIPMIPLLATAISIRISDYGFTELRYIVAALGLWLTGITLYFLLFKSSQIKIIPISLCIVGLVSTIGPQSAPSVSLRSQQARLVTLFESQGSYHEQGLAGMPPSISDSIGNEALQKIRYLVDHYGPEGLDNLLSDSLVTKLSATDTIENKSNRNQEVINIVTKNLNLKAYYNLQTPRRDFFHVSISEDSIPLTHSTFFRFVTFSQNVDEFPLTVDTLYIRNNSKSLAFPMKEVFGNVLQEYERVEQEYPRILNPRQLTVAGPDQEGNDVTLIIRELQLSLDSSQWEIQRLDGLLFH